MMENKGIGMPMRVMGVGHAPKKAQHRFLTLPNALSAMRLLATPLAVFLVLRHHYLLAAIVAVKAGLTDVLDKKIARHSPSQQSVVGFHLEKWASRIFFLSLAAALVYAGLLPPQLFHLFLAVDAFIILGNALVRYVSLKPPRTMKRLVAPKEDVVRVRPHKWMGYNRALQAMSSIAPLIHQNVAMNPAHFLYPTWYAAAATAVISTIWYAIRYPKYFRMAQLASEQKTLEAM